MKSTPLEGRVSQLSEQGAKPNPVIAFEIQGTSRSLDLRLTYVGG